MHGRFLYLAGLYLTTPVLSGLEPIIGCIILERWNSSTTVLLGSAMGMAVFFILAPPAKAQPQVLSADFEHALAKGDRPSRPGEGRCLFGAELAKLRSKLSVRPARRPIRSARCGCSIWRGLATRSTSSSPHAEQSWTRCAFFPRGANIIAMIAHGVLLDRYKLLRYAPQQ